MQSVRMPRYEKLDMLHHRSLSSMETFLLKPENNNQFLLEIIWLEEAKARPKFDFFALFGL